MGSGCTPNPVSEEERLPIWSKLDEEISEVLSTGYYDADVWRKRRTVGERDQDSFSDENGKGSDTLTPPFDTLTPPSLIY